MSGGGDTFLGRWSRRKLAHREAAGESEPEALADSGPDRDSAAQQDALQETPAQDVASAGDPLADLPDVETLDKDSDYTAFMRVGVPDELRNRALRRLWLSDPELANLDGLNDYDHDYAALLEEGAAVLKRLADAARSLASEEAADGTPASPAADDQAAADGDDPSAVAEDGSGEEESRRD